jgi:2-methylcitrate dehydratase PrpD
MSEITPILAAFAATTKAADIPAGATQMLRLSLLDWAACGIAGAEEPVARITRQMALDEGGAAQANLFGSPLHLPARAAALVNGATSHALDYDDTHFAHIGHPSVAVIPAALAVAQRQGSTGAEFQTAALIGIEASIRTGMWLGRDHYQIGFHQTATAGAFGAALAAARLMGLDAAGCAMTMGLVATRASGLKSQFGTMGKPFNAGLAASNGVEAATLVASGFVANPLALEAAQGFGDTHSAEELNSALQGIGKEWVFESVSHKFHACCHGLHAALEAAGSLGNIPADRIDSIQITTHPRWMSVCNQPSPTTGLGAKFSYGTVMAMHFLGHDTARLDSYSDALCADPALKALRQRVQVNDDPRIAETATILSVKMIDSNMLQAKHDLDEPMPIATRKAKIMAKATSLLGDEKSAHIWAMVQNAADPAELGKALHR